MGSVTLSLQFYMTVFALLDCNNFYASVERVFDARLHGRPVVVVTGDDGIIIARSAEAKALGIGMAVPVFQVKKTIEKHHVIKLSANFELYADMSSRVMELLEDFSPDIQIYSIDEAFFLVPDRTNLKKFGEEIRERVRKFTGLPVSIGFAATKTLTKLANYSGKRTGEVTDLYNKSELDLEYSLSQIPVEEVWGVGPASAKRLTRHGIADALALRNLDLKWARKTLNIVSGRTILELRGESCYGLTHTPDELSARKAITCSRSFGEAVTTKEEIKISAAYFVARAAERMRRLGFTARTLTFYLNTGKFSAENESYAKKFIYHSAVPSDADSELLNWTMDCIERIYRPGFAYKKAGVILSSLVPFHEANMRLIDEEHCRRLHYLMGTVDRMNLRHGRDTVHYARLNARNTQKTGRERSDENRSGSYTTRFNEILCLKDIG
jgi:DNA polymerase V